MTDSDSVHVVLVEDDEGHRNLIRRNLQRSGLTNPILEFLNGADFLTFLKENQSLPHPAELLVFLDLNMPVMDGFRVLEEVKGDPALKHTPIVVLTTTDNPVEVSRAYALGCNVFVPKPVDYKEFSKTIHTLGLFVSVLKTPASRKPK